MSASPVYERIEYCNDAKALWGKLESGRWDWLGVKADKKGRRPTFVLGAPSVVGWGDRGVMTIGPPAGAEPGVYTARIKTIGDPGWTEYHCGDENSARDRYAGLRRDAAQTGTDRPVLYKVQLIVDGIRVEDEFIVTKHVTTR